MSLPAHPSGITVNHTVVSFSFGADVSVFFQDSYTWGANSTYVAVGLRLLTAMIRASGGRKSNAANACRPLNLWVMKQTEAVWRHLLTMPQASAKHTSFKVILNSYTILLSISSTPNNFMFHWLHIICTEVPLRLGHAAFTLR